MPIRLKKFIGMILLLALVIVYAIAAMVFAVSQLADASTAMRLFFFFISGLLWILPAMGIIKWMMGRPQNPS